MVAAVFFLDDLSEIDAAVGRLAQSGVRIAVCASFEPELSDIAAAAERHGMLHTGYAWILVGSPSLQDVISHSQDPEKTQQRLMGWLVGSVNDLDEFVERYRTVFQNEPVEHVGDRALDEALAEAVADGLCDGYCGMMYDAVWTAAIAISRRDVADDGSVDRDALLREIRNVEFEGATGRVQYDAETGERDASEQPMMLSNLRLDADGRLAIMPAWRWLAGQDGQGS